MPSLFDLLSERLLRGGVARRYVRRYLAELQDHLDDLVGEERRAVGDAREAELRALARLGSAEALAGAMIPRREFRAWSARAPVATYLLAPPLALALCTSLAIAAVVIASTWFRSRGVSLDLPPWSRPLTDGVVFFSNAMLAVILGWVLGAMAIRQRSPALWPIFGMVVLAAAGAMLQVGVTLPSATGHGEIELARSFGPSFAQCAGYAGRLALNMALTLTPYASLGLWRWVRAKRDPVRG